MYIIKNKISLLKIAFVIVSCLELVFEYYENITFVFIAKALLLPTLIALYIVTSSRISTLYLLVLLLNYGANVFYISSDIKYIILAASFLILSRTLLFIKIYKMVKLQKSLPIVIGSMPFLILFLLLLNLVYESIPSEAFYMSLAQIILIAALGGISLANFVLKNDELSGYLLGSILFFSISLFVIGVKFYYIDLTILKSISMLFFIIAHYVLYKFVLLNEIREIENKG